MKTVSHRRVIGLGAAWIAAYALVLNIILSSVFLATLSPDAFAAGYEICANSAEMGGTGKTDKRAVVHCPICIGNHAATALPPPSSPLALDRAALPVSHALAFDAAFVELARTSDHQARGPPDLI